MQENQIKYGTGKMVSANSMDELRERYESLNHDIPPYRKWHVELNNRELEVQAHSCTINDKILKFYIIESEDSVLFAAFKTWESVTEILPSLSNDCLSDSDPQDPHM